MRRVRGLLLLAAGLLQGCGGGGGGGSKGGSEPAPTLYSLSAQVSGLEGSVTLTANAESPVTISSNTQTALARLSAGTQYNVQITSQPALHHCTLASSSGTLNADTTIAVTCVPRVAARKSTVGAFEVAHFAVAGLTLQAHQYSGSIDGTTPVTLAAVEGGLSLLMPPVAEGSHRLEVLIDGVSYPIALTVSSPVLPDTAEQIAANHMSELESALAALKSDPAFTGMADWTALDAELARLKAEIPTLSPTDLEAFARIVWMNELAPAAAGQGKSELFSPRKFNDLTCLDIHRRVTNHAIDSFAYLANGVAVVAMSVEFGPYGAVAGVTAAGALYVLKAWPSMTKFWAATKEYKGQQCFAFQRLNFNLQIEERFTQKPGVTSRLMSTTQETLTFNHKRTREYNVTGSGTLPEDLRESASLASSILRYASTLLSEEARQVLQEWTGTYTHPIDVSDFVIGNVSDARIRSNLSVLDGALRLRFEYLPNQMPSAPVDFTFTLAGNNQTWLIPARLNLIDPPVALNGDIGTQTNETFRGQLEAEFAESFRVSQQPVNGSVTLDATSGVYEYTPSTDFSGNDSFMFVAVNDRGESSPATVSITVSGLCELDNVGYRLERTCYTTEQKTQIDFVELLTVGSGEVSVLRYVPVELIPGDTNSIRTTERYSWRMFGAGSAWIEFEKAQWHVMPGNVIAVERDERASVDYTDGVVTRTFWSRWINNFSTMTGTKESISCYTGRYTWLHYSTTLDANGTMWDDEWIRNDFDLAGACPKTQEEKTSILPLKLEDIRVWQIWNAQNGG